VWRWCTTMCASTLLTLPPDEAISCLYEHADSGLVVIGSANGAVRLLFPRNSGDGAPTSNGVHPDQVAVQVGEKAEPVDYSYVLLRNRSAEAVRTAYIDAKTGRLLVSVGDVNVLVWDLANLQPTHAGVGAKCEVYAFDRHHAYGTCINSFLFQHEREFLLVIRNSVNVYWLRFDKHAWTSDSPAVQQQLLQQEQQQKGHPDSRKESSISLGEDDAELARSVLAPASAVTRFTGPSGAVRELPEQGSDKLTTPVNTVPTAFDGKRIIFLRCDKPGEFLVDVRDWQDEDKAVLRTITIRCSLVNTVTPFGLHSIGDFLTGVVNFNTIKLWSIRTGRELYSLKGHAHLSRVLAVRLVDPPPRLGRAQPAPSDDSVLIVSLGNDKVVVVWQDGRVLQRVALPARCAHFGMEGPYFLQPRFHRDSSTEEVTMTSLLFNDDTGAHVLKVA